MIQRTPGQSEETETNEAESAGPQALLPQALEPGVEGVALRSQGSDPAGGEVSEDISSEDVASPADVPEEAGEQVSPRSEEERAAAIALLVPQLEAILFVAREPIRTERLVATLGATKPDVRAALECLTERFSGERSGVHLVEIAGGWRFLSNPLFADTLAALHGTKAADRLSPAAMETLAIIAYKQPAGRAEIERIRGVGVGPIVRLLLELDLVRVAGREDGLGRALMYGTTKSFLDRFGLGSLRDLPAGLES